MHGCSEDTSKGNHKNAAVWSRLVSGRLVRKQARSIAEVLTTPH